MKILRVGTIIATPDNRLVLMGWLFDDGLPANVPLNAQAAARVALLHVASQQGIEFGAAPEQLTLESERLARGAIAVAKGASSGWIEPEPEPEAEPEADTWEEQAEEILALQRHIAERERRRNILTGCALVGLAGIVGAILGWLWGRG